jgi:hypothetical protein
MGIAGRDIGLQGQKIKRDIAFSSEVDTGSREENASKKHKVPYQRDHPPSIRLTILAA